MSTPPEGFDLVQWANQERQYGRKMAKKAASANRTVAFIGEENRRRGRLNDDYRAKIKALETELEVHRANREKRPVSYHEDVAELIRGRYANRLLADLTADEMDIMAVLTGYSALAKEVERLRTVVRNHASAMVAEMQQGL